MPSGVRSPFEWLQALQKAKGDQTQVKLTIADIIDRCNDPNATGSVEPTSPRSVDACLRLGIEPYELKFISKEQFQTNLDDSDLAELAFKHHDGIRQERLNALQEERKKIIEEGGEGHHKAKIGSAQVKGFDSADIVEKEEKRLEVIRRRQERELKQLLHFEAMRKELQEKGESKIKKVQQRAEAERKAKAEKEREYLKHQREREQQKLKDEAEREKQIKTAEMARYEKEMEAAKRLADAETERKHLARQREMERAAKVEKSRKETERLLAKQQADIDRKKEEMEQRDKEHEVIKLQQQKDAAAKNLQAHLKAEERFQATLKTNTAILAKRRADYETKEKQAEDRRKQKEVVRQAEEAKLQAEEAAKAEQRKKAYSEAQRTEAERVANITERQKAKESSLEELNKKRNHEADMRNLQHQLDLESKRDKVEAMKRRDLYHRMSLLERINANTDKARSLVEQRSNLQEQRRTANMEASFQRQRLQKTVAVLQAKKDWSKEINVQDVLSNTLGK